MPDPETPETAHLPNALEAKGLSRRFTTRAGETVGVRDVSLAIAPGELLALLGPNGSGKSTLMGMLATIDAPEAGEVVYPSPGGTVTISPGATNADRRRARALVGVAFQAHILDPLLTVRENLLVAASLYGIARPQPRIDELLATLRIADRAHDRVGTLSGGLSRRADLARAMLHRPRVLLLDEPSAGLDPEARDTLLATLDDLRGRSGHRADAPAILMTTHLTEEADRADRVAILSRGVIVREGSPSTLRGSLGDRLLVIEHDPGADLVREAAAARELLTDAGLSGATSADASRPRTTAPLEGDHADALNALLGAGLRFRVGPPDLADVYLDAIARDARPAQGAHR